MNIFSYYIERFEKVRFITIIVITLMMIAVGYQMKNLSLSADTRVYFNDDNENLIAFDKLKADFTKDDNILIVLQNKYGNVFDKKTLNIVNEMTEESWQLPYSRRVDSLTNFQHSYAEGDDIIVESLFYDLENLSDEKIQEKALVAIQQPELLNSILSADSKITAINIAITTPELNRSVEIPEVVNATQELIKKYQNLYPNVAFYLGGQVILNNAFSETSRGDVKNLYPIMIFGILILLGIVFLRILPTLATFTIVIFSCVFTMGIAGIFGLSLAPVVINAPIMIMTLAIADCVHIFVNYYENLRNTPDRIEAMRESLKINFKPILLTSVTTAIGFLSLNFSESPPFRVMGNLVALGVFFAFLLSVVLLPAIVTFFPARASINSTVSNSWTLLQKGYVRWSSIIILITVIVSIFSIFGVRENIINDTSVEFFSIDTQFRQDAEFINSNLTGISQINYAIPAAVDDSIMDIKYLTTLDSFISWLKEQPEVVHISSFTETLKRLNKNMHNEDELFYRIPESSELASQYMLLYEMSLPYGLDLTNRININKTASRVVINLEKSSANELITFDNRVKMWMTENAPTHMHSTAASPAMMFAHVSHTNAQSMVVGMLVALIAISLIVMLTLRSVRLGFVSLLMNCLPMMIAFAIWGTLVGRVGLGVSMVLGISLGIVVDNSIHFLSKYAHAYRKLNYSPSESIRYSLETVGRALVITTISVCSGFIVIAFSDFSINAEMGIMTSAVIGIALVVDLLFIPPILALITRQRI